MPFLHQNPRKQHSTAPQTHVGLYLEVSTSPLMPGKQICYFYESLRDVLSNEDDRQLGVGSVRYSSGNHKGQFLQKGRRPPHHTLSVIPASYKSHLLFHKLTGSSAGGPGYKDWLFQQHRIRESDLGAPALVTAHTRHASSHFLPEGPHGPWLLVCAVDTPSCPGLGSFLFFTSLDMEAEQVGTKVLLINFQHHALRCLLLPRRLFLYTLSPFPCRPSCWSYGMHSGERQIRRCSEVRI